MSDFIILIACVDTHVLIHYRPIGASCTVQRATMSMSAGAFHAACGTHGCKKAPTHSWKGRAWQSSHETWSNKAIKLDVSREYDPIGRLNTS